MSNFPFDASQVRELGAKDVWIKSNERLRLLIQSSSGEEPIQMTLGLDVNTTLGRRRSIHTYHDLGTTMNKVMDECVLPLIACHDVMILTGKSPNPKH